MKPTAPPAGVIHEAVVAARRSPCCKSKRGAVIFEPDHDDWESPIHVAIASGFNGPPGLIHCDGSDACRRDCPKICMHAEERAMLQLNRDEWERYGDGGMHLQHLDLVHVKVVNGELVAGGPPSCWQCSRTIYDALIGGVWLYERDPLAPECPGPDCPMCNGEACNICAESYEGEACEHAADERHRNEPEAPPARWVRYTSEEFHRLTLRNQKERPLYAPARR